MTTRLLGRDWSITVTSEPIPITSMSPSLDPSWSYVDAAGHTHRYEDVSTRHEDVSTLNHVIDTSHFCDGYEGAFWHDPHVEIDTSHYECRQCEEVIEPGLIPGGMTTYLSGPVEAVLEGVRGDGASIRVFLADEEYAALVAARERIDEAVRAFLENPPEERTEVTRYFTF